MFSLRAEQGLTARGKGEPRICDSGMAQIVEEIGNSTQTANSRDDARYAAPEQIENSGVTATKEADTCSFGMLILECITEKRPFYNYSRDALVLHARIAKKLCPPRPDGQDQRNRVSDELWELMMRCWSARPDHRPTMEQVHSFFLNQDSTMY